MANNRNTYQQKHTVSIPREALKEIAENEELSKTDIRVLLALMTELDGWSEPTGSNWVDPKNFKIIDMDTIADFLYLKHKEVKKSVKNLINQGLIEKGNSESVTNGYRFTF